MEETLKSVQNEIELRTLAEKINFSYISFLGAPDKEFSKESLVADVKKFFADIVERREEFEEANFTYLD